MVTTQGLGRIGVAWWNNALASPVDVDLKLAHGLQALPGKTSELGHSTAEWKGRIAARRAQIAAHEGEWNEEIAALAGYNTSDRGLTLTLGTTDYATSSVVRNTWKASPPAWDGRTPPVVTPTLSHMCGVSISLVTADGDLLVSRRSARVSTYQGWMSATVNESMRPDDNDKLGRLSFDAAVARGLKEELGCDVPPRCCIAQSLVMSYEEGIWVLGVVCDLRDTDWTTARLRESHSTAPDGWEADLIAIPPNVDALRLALSKDDWVPVTVPCIMAAAVLAQGDFVVEARSLLVRHIPEQQMNLVSL